MPRGRFRENLQGHVFGRLTVLGSPEVRGAHAFWLCRCICGTEKMVGAKELKRVPGTTSCGCQRGHARGAQLRTHGESYKNVTAEYSVYHQMLGRCQQPGNGSYKHYGARGIAVCERWLGAGGYRNFLEDIGRRPSAKHQLERKNNDGDYEPDNCVWATRVEQANNRRNNHTVTYAGETLSLSEWARRYNLKPSTIRGRLRKGWPVERALLSAVAT